MSDELSKGTQTRAAILEAAKTLFLSQGYNGTSMRAIAQASGGRAVAGLYNHFETKEAIFHALIEERNPYADLLPIFERSADVAQSAPDFIEQVLRTVLTVMPRYYDFLQLVQIDLREFEGRNMRRVLAHFFPAILAVFSRAQALPGLKPIPENTGIRLLASITIGYLVTEQLAPPGMFDTLPNPTWIDLYVETMLHGLAQPGDLSAPAES